MKKTLVAAMSAAVVASAFYAFAQTNSVYSGNAVGFIRVDMPKGQYTMVSRPMNEVGGTNGISVANLMGTNYPSGTQVLLWAPSQQYIIATYDSEDGWTPAASNMIYRGMGFFVRIPSSYTGDVFTAYFTGEVPGETNAVVNVIPGFQMVSFAYPTERTVSTTTLGKTGGEQLMSYSSNGWNITTYDTEDGWTKPNFMLKPGEGYFFKCNNITNWTEVKPYVYP